MIIKKDSVLELTGEWTLPNFETLKSALQNIQLDANKPESLTIDGSKLESIDTNGCLCLREFIDIAESKNQTVELKNFKPTHLDLFNFIKHRTENGLSAPPLIKKSNFFAEVGESAINFVTEALAFLSFIGSVFIILFFKLLRPWKIRWKPFWANIQTAGVYALPIVGLLNFLIGFVITFQGGSLLRMFGANIYAIDLIVVATLRVLGPLLTAIIIAGRTGSAYAAQIGTMVVNEEVDALKTVGIDPLDQLVIPKLLALTIALPFLTLFADIMSIFGGMVLSLFYLDISFAEFIAKIPDSVTINSLIVGLAQAPIFAFIIVLVGCYQGFQVEGGADSVGKQTTKSVVQAIFLVIIFEAIFTIVMRDIGL